MPLFTSVPSASRLAVTLSLGALLLSTACSTPPATETSPSASSALTHTDSNANSIPADMAADSPATQSAPTTAAESPTTQSAPGTVSNTANPQAGTSPTGQLPEMTAADLFVLSSQDAGKFNAAFAQHRLRLHGNFVKYRPDLKMVYIGSEHTESDHGFVVAQADQELPGLDQLATMAPGSALTVDVTILNAKSEAGVLILAAKLLNIPAQDDRQYELITAKDLLSSVTKDIVGAAEKYQGRVLIIEGVIAGEERHGKLSRPFKLMRPQGVPAYSQVPGLSADSMATLSKITPFVGINIFDDNRPDQETILPRFNALKTGDKVRARVKIMLVDPVGVYCNLLSVDVL